MRSSSSKENSASNFVKETDILHNFERHKSVIREHQERQRRIEVKRKLAAEAEVQQREQALRKLKDEKRVLYERFLKVNRSSSKSKNEDRREANLDFNQTTKPLPPKKGADKPAADPKPGSSKAVLTKLNQKFQPVPTKTISDEEFWANFETVEKQVFKSVSSQPPDKRQLEIEAQLDKLIAEEKAPSTQPEQPTTSTLKASFKPVDRRQFGGDEDIPQKLVREISEQNESELRLAESNWQRNVSSSMRFQLQKHISKGRSMAQPDDRDVRLSELEKQEQFLLQSIQDLNEKSSKLSACKSDNKRLVDFSKKNENPPIKSDPVSSPRKDRLAIIDSLDKLEAEAERQQATFNARIQNAQTTAPPESSQKPLSQLNETQSYSLISELSNTTRPDIHKNSYARQSIRRREFAVPAIQEKPTEENESKTDGRNKLVFNPLRLKELLDN